VNGAPGRAAARAGTPAKPVFPHDGAPARCAADSRAYSHDRAVRRPGARAGPLLARLSANAGAGDGTGARYRRQASTARSGMPSADSTRASMCSAFMAATAYMSRGLAWSMKMSGSTIDR